MEPTQALNDGVINVYAVTNAAQPGEAPSTSTTLKCSLRFKRRTVGITRYYKALQANAKVDLLLRVPYIPTVSTQDVVTVNGGSDQYVVTLIQAIEDSAPPVMDLTLERMAENYDLS